MIMNNKIIIIALIGWITAQVLKVILTSISEKKLNFGKFFESGGMPSSHSSLVVSLATGVGRTTGVESVEFAISLVFALIVMYDAAGVRRAAGKQAKALNKLIEEFYVEKPRVDERLKELLGHTPIEVLAGAALGLILGLSI